MGKALNHGNLTTNEVDQLVQSVAQVIKKIVYPAKKTLGFLVKVFLLAFFQAQRVSSAFLFSASLFYRDSQPRSLLFSLHLKNADENQWVYIDHTKFLLEKIKYRAKVNLKKRFYKFHHLLNFAITYYLTQDVHHPAVL